MYDNEWTRPCLVELGMRRLPTRPSRWLAVLAACLFVLIGRDALAKPYASEMPTVEEVRAKVHGTSPLDTEVRQHTFFVHLAYALGVLLGDAPSAPEDRVLLQSYRDAREAAKARGQALWAKSPKGPIFDQLVQAYSPRAR